MRLREATLDDADILFRWRNDPWTCAMSLSNKPVGWEEHLRWVNNMIANHPIYIFLDNLNRPVGTANVRFGELSYTIAPEHRGKGLARIMLGMIKAQHGALICKIKKINTPSIKAARMSGHVVDIV